MRFWRLCVGLPVLVGFMGLAGCTNGVREFGQYTEAFNLQYQQGDEFLNTVAKAERELFRRRERRSQVTDRYNPDNAAYYVDSVDPPVTASIRGSIKALKLYNDALSALASGESAEALTNRVGSLVTNIVGTAAAIEVAAAGPAAAVGAESLVAGAGKYISEATPFFKQFATWASREAFRQQLVSAYPAMKDLLQALRKGTPKIYALLENYRKDRAPTPTGFSAAAADALNKDRESLSGWVLLMDKTLETMDAAVIATMGNSPDSVVASLSSTSSDLKVLAEKVKSLRAK
jgi:hypothetical protein